MSGKVEGKGVQVSAFETTCEDELEVVRRGEFRWEAGDPFSVSPEELTMKEMMKIDECEAGGLYE